MSTSIKVGPVDARCSYWAIMVRAGQPLPHPENARGAADLVQRFVPTRRDGRPVDEELFPGDMLFEGEQVKHNRDYGWTYQVRWLAPDGDEVKLRPGSEVKADLKAKGLAPDLLRGAGQLAACVRVAHALRAGLEAGGHRMADAQTTDETASNSALPEPINPPLGH